MQGMRRSGTTIIFDLLWQDSSLDCYYEPLAKAEKHAKGGGSGMTGTDYFEKVRAVRHSYMEKDPSVKDFKTLNYGAPKDASLEFDTNPPAYVAGFVRHMTEQAPVTMIKFTRMYNKVHVLHELDPEARFVQIVRDPRAMAASYLFGKGQKHKGKFTPEDKFFGKRSNYTAWSSFPFSEHLLSTEEFSHVKDPLDFMRVLIVWQHTFKNTYHAAKKLYGDRFFLLRHEDLLNSPRETIEKLYAHMERGVPEELMEWAEKNLRKPSPPYMHDDDRWLHAFREIGMLEEIELAGYSDCLREPSPKTVSEKKSLLGSLFGR